MTWLLSKFMGYLLPGVAIVLAVALLAVGVQTHRVKIAKQATAEVQKAWTLDRAQATAAALVETERYRALETLMQSAKEQAQHEYDAATTRNAGRLATARAGADKLRNQLAAYASNASSTAPDSVSACDQRAAALGELLARALQSDASHASAAESNGDAVRALLAAWPHDADVAQ